LVVLAAGIGGYAVWRISLDESARRAAPQEALLGSGGPDNAFGSPNDTSGSATVSVTYSVSVNGYQENELEADADITYETPTGVQQDEVDDGWSRTFTFVRGEFVYISVQNMTEGTVSCSIEVNGTTNAANSSSGEFKIATCDGRAE
jgi:hypothetical protein